MIKFFLKSQDHGVYMFVRKVFFFKVNYHKAQTGLVPTLTIFIHTGWYDMVLIGNMLSRPSYINFV